MAFYNQTQSNLYSIIAGGVSTAVSRWNPPVGLVGDALIASYLMNQEYLSNLLFRNFGSDQTFWLRTEYGRTTAYDVYGNAVFQYNTMYAF
jgi:hypothetical protein